MFDVDDLYEAASTLQRTAQYLRQCFTIAGSVPQVVELRAQKLDRVAAWLNDLANAFATARVDDEEPEM